MSALQKNLYVAIAELIRRRVHTFTPQLLTSEVSAVTGQPESHILGEVLRECEVLVRQSMLWSPQNGASMRENTALVATAERLLPMLDREIGPMFA